MWFRFKRITKNSSDNNISISNDNNILFQIGENLGEIKSILKNSNTNIKLHSKKILELEKRIMTIEKTLKIKL